MRSKLLLWWRQQWQVGIGYLKEKVVLEQLRRDYRKSARCAQLLPDYLAAVEYQLLESGAGAGERWR